MNTTNILFSKFNQSICRCMVLLSGVLLLTACTSPKFQTVFKQTPFIDSVQCVHLHSNIPSSVNELNQALNTIAPDVFAEHKIKYCGFSEGQRLSSFANASHVLLVEIPLYRQAYNVKGSWGKFVANVVLSDASASVVIWRGNVAMEEIDRTPFDQRVMMQKLLRTTLTELNALSSNSVNK